jgi:Ca-activated chloride channel family protein
VAPASDDLVGSKFELLIGEEPPLSDDRDLPPAATSTRWQAVKPAKVAQKPPVPGTSLSDAPVLVDGTYQTTILTGETQVFGVNADWGQRVQVDVVVAPRRGALARALDVSDTLDLQLLGAGRGRYANLQVPGLPDRSYGMADDAKRYRFAASTPTIRYTNRSQPGAVSYASVPGTQQVVLNMSSRQKKPFLVPYTLVVKVVGTAGSGKPDYVQAATPTPTPTPEPTTVAPPTTQPPVPPPTDAPSTGVPMAMVVGLAVGTLALGAVGAVVIGSLRRRRRARP